VDFIIVGKDFLSNGILTRAPPTLPEPISKMATNFSFFLDVNKNPITYTLYPVLDFFTKAIKVYFYIKRKKALNHKFEFSAF
jgi:hypothetical protein